jgi:protein-tyrosine phosphatase
MPELEQLCYAGTKYLLLELPVQRWDRFLFDQIYAIPQLTGLVPVIAHLERYFVGQSRNNLETLCSMGFPVQISGRALLRLSGRARALGALRDGKAQLLISDCHSMPSRPPELAPAMRVIERRLGREAARASDCPYG